MFFYFAVYCINLMLGKCGYLLLSLAMRVVESTELQRIKTYVVLQLSAGETSNHKILR